MTCLVACDAGKTLLVPICWIAKGIFPANTEVKTKKQIHATKQWSSRKTSVFLDLRNIPQAASSNSFLYFARGGQEKAKDYRIFLNFKLHQFDSNSVCTFSNSRRKSSKAFLFLFPCLVMKEKQKEQKDEKQTKIPVSLIHDLTIFGLY